MFDQKDYDLIEIVNDVLSGGRVIRRSFYHYFHPNGIKEMAETKGIRSAYAVIQLLNSLEVGGVDDRINALAALRLEVIDTAEGPMPKNTARVLLQIMKELVRAHGDRRRQLELAHDFHMTASGRPRIVREQLKKYHLLEMPENWNQLAFDDHVHDANTKGRKSSTHLLMDAWIKGIRRLRIIHYNFIEPRFAAELFEAARILDIEVRMGIEFYAAFRGRYIQLIWVPRGFADSQAFLCFLEEPHVRELMDAGRSASRYQQRHVLSLLRNFNEQHRREIGKRLGIEVSELKEDEFLAFVGIGQKSRLHLSKFIQNKITDALRLKAKALCDEMERAGPERKDEIRRWVDKADKLDLEALVDEYLTRERNPDIEFPDRPSADPETPELLRLAPCEILSRLSSLHSGYRVTLNLTDLTAADVLELLYDCQGMITRLELFNLKDSYEGKTPDLAEILRLMRAINEGSVIHLKQIIREMISGLSSEESPDKKDQMEKLTSILYDIDTLKSFYLGRSLKPRAGSDSTGRSPRLHGMGLAVIETLPRRAQREISKGRSGTVRDIIPLRIPVYRTISFMPASDSLGEERRRGSNWGLPLAYLFTPYKETWQADTRHASKEMEGNIVTLGGARRILSNNLLAKRETSNHVPFSIRYLNSKLKNLLKVLIGFSPAFATFALTKDWWPLAYGGAFIWFGITGLRNILQSVLGGGGLRRSPLLNWNDYISWSRITASLMFTGFSVPMLDYLVKTLILDHGLGINATSAPFMLYFSMALANGLYISGHNLIRGLPKTAVYGNFFRTIISIPLALLINDAAGAVMSHLAVADVAGVLQKWAAIISKTASDTVAGFIEGIADRRQNILRRLKDYKVKFEQLFDIYGQLELIYPEIKPFAVLEHSCELKRKVSLEARDLEKIIMIHGLDLLYFWMYQPRARTALRLFVSRLSEDERQVLASSQFTLHRQKEISQMFIDGILGDNFAKPLSFYLSRNEEYLEEVKRILF
jgi:hypothetical protein